MKTMFRARLNILILDVLLTNLEASGSSVLANELLSQSAHRGSKNYIRPNLSQDQAGEIAAALQLVPAEAQTPLVKDTITRMLAASAAPAPVDVAPLPATAENAPVAAAVPAAQQTTDSAVSVTADATAGLSVASAHC